MWIILQMDTLISVAWREHTSSRLYVMLTHQLPISLRVALDVVITKTWTVSCKFQQLAVLEYLIGVYLIITFLFHIRRLFHNCTCGSERMVRGSCTLPSCRFSFNLYQFFFTVVVAISGNLNLKPRLKMKQARKARLAAVETFLTTPKRMAVVGSWMYILFTITMKS